MNSSVLANVHSGERRLYPQQMLILTLAVGPCLFNYTDGVPQVIASHGRTFTGSWLSTFTAYIFRLRGYLQMPRK